jgi:hypothetical protein
MLCSTLEAGVRSRVAVILLSSVLAAVGARSVSAQTVANPQLIEFIPPSSTTTTAATTSYLGDLAWTSATNDYGPVERNKSNGEDLAGDGAAITLNGVTYPKGLGVHAASTIKYALSSCSQFSAVIGVDDEVGSNGTIAFQVWTDGTQRFDSGVMTGSMAGRSVTVDTTGAKELALIVTDAGDGSNYDHGDWANAQIACGSTGSSSITRYDVEIAVAGTTQVLQRVTLGLPPRDADGMIRANFAKDLIVTPVAGTSYDAKVLTVTTSSTITSARSNAFTFSACAYQLSATSASAPATGGSGTFNVSTNYSWCAWTPASSAAWLQVGASGPVTGSNTVPYTVAPNTTSASRTATITVAGATFSVTQSGSAAQTLDVTTEADLQKAVAALASNTTLRLAPGTYQLTAPLQIRGPLSGVSIKSSTGRASDVAIVGQGMTTNGTVPTAITVTGAVQGLQISDLTIQSVYKHAILFDNGPQAPRLSNLRLLDCGDACVKTLLTTGAPSVDDGLVETSWIGYTTTGATSTAGGIDLRGSKRWIVRTSTFQNIRGANGQTSRPAVATSGGGADTTVERSMFVNNSVAVSLGLSDLSGSYDHTGGRVANNFISRTASVAGGPGVSIVDSPDTIVANNTVVLSKTYASPIEYRFAGASNVRLTNNLTDGPLTARDGAAATAAGNVTSATADMFVNAAAGDLHLTSTAAGVIDLAEVSTAEARDFDNQSRPMDLAPDVGADETSRTNTAATVQIVNPVNGSIYKRGSTIELQATAQDPDGQITKVEFYVNSTLVGSTTASPYVVAWKPGNGRYAIVAVATDNLGGRTSSAAVTISVTNKGR